VVEGDGGLLMGFTAMTTIGRLKPKKLLLIVLDNGTYAATGDQPSGAEATDFVGVARACGFEGRDVEGAAALEQALIEARQTDGPLLLRVRIGLENARANYFLEDPVVLIDGFRQYLKQHAS
jgi:thiamine pyrophosphate-dependent acetolactate synthase large subunit-like protein